MFDLQYLTALEKNSSAQNLSEPKYEMDFPNVIELELRDLGIFCEMPSYFEIFKRRLVGK